MAPLPPHTTPVLSGMVPNWSTSSDDTMAVPVELGDSPHPSHPSYSFPDADLVISSRDGTRFHVHSQILKLASGVFRNILAAPRDDSENPTDRIIFVTESTSVFATILDAAYPYFGRERHNLWEAVVKSPDVIADAAEKYDMPGLLCAIRSHIFHEEAGLQILAQAPIRMYTFCEIRGWKEEAGIASSKTIGLDLTFPEAISELEKIDFRSAIRLLELHRKRKERLLRAIESVPKRKCTCHRSPHGSLDGYSVWGAFLYLVCKKMMEPSYADIPVSAAFWAEPSCHGLFSCKIVCISSKDAFIAEVKKAIDELPKSV